MLTPARSTWPAVLMAALSLAASSGRAEQVYVLAPPTAAEQDDTTKLVLDVVAEALASRGHRVLSAEDVKEAAVLEADKQLLGCEDDASCLAALAEVTKADWIVSARVGQVGRETVLSLSLVDTRTRSVIARQSGPVVASNAGAGDELVADAAAAPVDVKAAVDALVGRLLGVDAEKRAFSLPGGEKSFAVLDLKAAGVDATTAQNLTQILSAELKKVDGATVIGRDDIAAILQYESNREMLGCSDDNSCLAELGDALGVERIVVGQVGKVADSYVLSLRLIRTADVAVDNRVTETFRGEEEQLLGAVRIALLRLVGLSPTKPGGVFVSCSEEGAELFVDGKEQGRLPRAPVMGLAPGRHEVRVVHDGYYDFRGDVYVGPGETVNQWVQLNERPAPFYMTWPFWAAVGAGGAAAFAVTATLTAGGIGFGAYEYLRPRPIGPVSATLPVRE
jgi:hypothetical protein